MTLVDSTFRFKTDPNYVQRGVRRLRQWFHFIWGTSSGCRLILWGLMVDFVGFLQASPVLSWTPPALVFQFQLDAVRLRLHFPREKGKYLRYSKTRKSHEPITTQARHQALVNLLLELSKGKYSWKLENRSTKNHFREGRSAAARAFYLTSGKITEAEKRQKAFLLTPLTTSTNEKQLWLGWGLPGSGSFLFMPGTRQASQASSLSSSLHSRRCIRDRVCLIAGISPVNIWRKNSQTGNQPASCYSSFGRPRLLPTTLHTHQCGPTWTGEAGKKAKQSFSHPLATISWEAGAEKCSYSSERLGHPDCTTKVKHIGLVMSESW